jgi:hypothetical protein
LQVSENHTTQGTHGYDLKQWLGNIDRRQDHECRVIKENVVVAGAIVVVLVVAAKIPKTATYSILG